MRRKLGLLRRVTARSRDLALLACPRAGVARGRRGRHDGERSRLFRNERDCLERVPREVNPAVLDLLRRDVGVKPMMRQDERADGDEAVERDQVPFNRARWRNRRCAMSCRPWSGSGRKWGKRRERRELAGTRKAEAILRRESGRREGDVVLARACCWRNELGLLHRALKSSAPKRSAHGLGLAQEQHQSHLVCTFDRPERKSSLAVPLRKLRQLAAAFVPVAQILVHGVGTTLHSHHRPCGPALGRSCRRDVPVGLCLDLDSRTHAAGRAYAPSSGVVGADGIAS